MYKSHFNIIEPYPGWLDEFVTTSEAAKITGVPKPHWSPCDHAAEMAQFS